MLTVTRIAVCAAMALCVLASMGCATNRVNLVESGQAKLVVRRNTPARLSGVTVYQAGDEVRISGYAQRRASPYVPLRGHIDVFVLNPQGQVLEQAVAPLVMTRTSRIAPYGAFFHAYVPGTLPEGASVQVRYHAGSCT